jgi:nicotinate-nucleotide adenylyltransferase
VRTGILGGTFDPIHLAHLHAAETALDQGALDRVLFMPAGQPWQKSDRDVTGAGHRLEMVRLAISGAPGFELDRREIDRDGPTYTIETLESFPSHDQVYLILGSDAAAGLETWHRYADVIERAGLLIAPRPGYPGAEVVVRHKAATLLEMAPLGVSSTMIRKMAGEGRPYRYLVTDRVHDYIRENNLYVP